MVSPFTTIDPAKIDLLSIIKIFRSPNFLDEMAKYYTPRARSISNSHVVSTPGTIGYTSGMHNELGLRKQRCNSSLATHIRNH